MGSQGTMVGFMLSGISVDGPPQTFTRLSWLLRQCLLPKTPQIEPASSLSPDKKLKSLALPSGLEHLFSP
jgi:hypothetical protein